VSADLGLRLRREGVLVRRDPRLRVFVGAPGLHGLLRREACRAQTYLQARPGGFQPVPSERRTWFRQLGSWAVQSVAVAVVAAWFAASAAQRATAALVGTPAYALHASVWVARSWSELVSTAAVWYLALVAPAVIWCVNRRDLAARTLWRGAMTRPLVVALRPVALAWSLGRHLAGRDIWPPAAWEPRAATATDAGRDANPHIFVDTTGRRRRRLWALAYGAGLAVVLYVAALGFALASQPTDSFADTLTDQLQAGPGPADPASQPTLVPTETDPAATEPMTAATDSGSSSPTDSPLTDATLPTPTTLTEVIAPAQPVTPTQTLAPAQPATTSEATVGLSALAWSPDVVIPLPRDAR
jgi:hypothetical protein